MAATEIRSIGVSLTVDGKVRHPAMIIANLKVNAYPTVQTVHHVDIHAQDAAVEMSSAEVCAEMAGRQAKLFSENPPKLMLAVQDGQGGTLAFDGFVQNPIYGFSAFSVNLSDTALPNYAAMDNLNYSCYVTAFTKSPSKTEGLGFASGAKTVPEILLNMGEFMLDRWAKTYSQLQQNPSIQAELTARQDSINQKVKPYFKELVSNSKDTFGWEDLPSKLQSTTGHICDKGITDRCQDILYNNSGSFLSSICRFAEEYQCIYVPQWNNVGHIVNKGNILNSPQDYKADIINMNVSVGGRGMFPVRYIAVTAARRTDSPSHQQPGNACYVVYPEDMVASGSMIPKAGPPWLPDTIMTQEINTSGYTSRQLAIKMRDLRQDAEYRVKEAKQMERNKRGILSEWAKRCYIWEALGNTSATLTVPLDVSLQVGVRYNVKNSKGQDLFSGFLSEVTHMIKSASGTSSNCQTTLKFTHVTLTGFELPLD